MFCLWLKIINSPCCTFVAYYYLLQLPLVRVICFLSNVYTGSEVTCVWLVR